MALDVTFYNIDTDMAETKAANRSLLESIQTPPFLSHKEDIAALRTKLEPYQKYENILIIGNGGSIWSFMPLYVALADRVNGKTVVPVTDMEPDNINILKAKYPKETTVVLVISKSGSTVGVIEDLFVFADYPAIYVTDPAGTIGEIGSRRNVQIIPHPIVGGRYSTFTCCAYVPAILAGLDVEEIEAGGRRFYGEYSDLDDRNNNALDTALVLNELEDKGYTEMFLPIYSNFFQTFGNIVTQLFHESFGKVGKGITVVAAQAPESQHHTNQRFFGGRKNMVGCFTRVVNQIDVVSKVSVPTELHDIPLRTGTLADIDGLRLTDSFRSEYEGTFTNAKNQNIPIIDIAIAEVSPYTVGALMAFWHYVTVYSAALRQVDPFDQPQVEASKVISFEQRKASKQS